MRIRDIVRSVSMYYSAFIVGVFAASLVLAPAAFAEDAYVESLKANTVFTDYYANQNTRIELDFEWLAGDYGDASVAHGGMVIGPWSDGCGTATAFWNAGGANGMQFIVAAATGNSSTPGASYPPRAGSSQSTVTMGNF